MIGFDGFPVTIVEKFTHPFDQFGNKRCSDKIIITELPDPSKGRIAELQPPITTDNGNRFVKVVEGFLLNGDQRVVRPLERERCRGCFPGKQETAKRVRRK